MKSKAIDTGAPCFFVMMEPTQMSTARRARQPKGGLQMEGPNDTAEAGSVDVAEQPNESSFDIADLVKANRVKALTLQAHSYNVFSVMVRSLLPKEVLELPELWTHIGRQVRVGDEIRVTAEDTSFYAQLYVYFVHGSDVKTKVVNYVELEAVDYEALNQQHSPYFVAQRPGKNWCVIKRDNGEILFSNIASQSLAAREMEDYLRALNS